MLKWFDGRHRIQDYGVQHDSARGRWVALATSLLMATTLASQASAQSIDSARERGFGGSGSPAIGQAKKPTRPANKVAAVSITIEREDELIIRPAEGVPVDVFGNDRAADGSQEKATTSVRNQNSQPTNADTALGDVTEVAQGQTGTSQTVDASNNGDSRTTPPTASELIAKAKGRAIKTSTLNVPLAIAPAAAAPTPEIKPRALIEAAPAAPAPVEQAQFAPNAAAEPKAILAPRVVEAPSTNAPAAASVMPSPRRPVPEAALQQTALSPNLAQSPEESILRTAPTPDNTLVQLVETPSDYSLEVEPGGSKAMKLGKAVVDVFVADPDIADVKPISPTQMIVYGNSLGRTDIFGFDERGDVVFAIDVDVVPDAVAAQQKLQSASPTTATSVSLESGTLVAAGDVGNVGEAIKVDNVAQGLTRTQGPTINNTTIEGSQQVNIRVRFAEVSRNDVFNLGVNWDALLNTGDFLFGLSTGNFLGEIGDLSAREISSIGGEDFGRFDFSGEFGDVSIDAFIDALQREGIVNLLAEPSLTAVNGESANFLAGGEIPILVPGGGGSETVTIEYKPFGVSLDFVPTLLPGERINLRVRPEVSSISPSDIILDGFQVPSFTVRRAETSVELASGQTFAIAGLFQRDLFTDTDKFPLFGDLPVLGQLFQSQRFQRKETELVILITPYLVKPINNPNVVVPNDRLDLPAQPLARKQGRRAGFIVN